jgi:hypothetical protein
MNCFFQTILGMGGSVEDVFLKNYLGVESPSRVEKYHFLGSSKEVIRLGRWGPKITYNVGLPWPRNRNKLGFT